MARWAHTTVWGFPLPDLLLAAALCLIAVACVLTGNPYEGPIALTLPVAVVMTAALAWRVRNGIFAVALVVAAGVVQTVGSGSPGSLWSLAVYAILMYSVSARYTESVAAIVGAGLVAALLIEERIDDGVDYFFILLMFGGIWLLGRASRHWRGRVSAAEERQREAARLAVAEERVRIARDLHDVIAHSLSVIAVQSDAAQAALEHDPARATAPLHAIRSTARGALDEIRQMLDLLRFDDADRPADHSPGISAIDGLVAAARSAGVNVEYRVTVTKAPLAPALDLAAYRAVQEGLTNVIKHAPGSDVQVVVDQTDRLLRVGVTNTRPQSSSTESGTTPTSFDRAHYGLVGVSERVTALGGNATAGPTSSGGFQLTLELPVVPARVARVR
jgi:signal transduction histidine kinase